MFTFEKLSIYIFFYSSQLNANEISLAFACGDWGVSMIDYVLGIDPWIAYSLRYVYCNLLKIQKTTKKTKNIYDLQVVQN